MDVNKIIGNKYSEILYINSLPELEEYSNKLVEELHSAEQSIHKYITSNDEEELTVSIMIILDDMMTNNPNLLIKEDYDEIIHTIIEEESREMLENIITDNVRQLNKEQYESKVQSLISKIQDNYYNHILPRSYEKTYISENVTEKDKIIIDEKIKLIDEKDKQQPPQRTPGWYEVRYNLLSASSIGKCFSTQSSLNKLIYDKCALQDISKYENVNINSSLHWGQKYEPISQAYYEYKYNTKINEYGCIIHSKYKFIGASPDGINVKREHPNYGRMLEIKNIVNREITGIPKADYWVQMQIQMECCDLDECDFLECRFIEYEDMNKFISDGDNFNYSEDGCHKGIYIQFFKDNKTYYEYPPIFNISETEFNKWREEIMEKNENSTWIRDIYWKLDEVSCVLVPRNQFWFINNINYLSEVWNIILKERENGEYINRKKNTKTGTATSLKINNENKNIENDNIKNIKLTNMFLNLSHKEMNKDYNESPVKKKIIRKKQKMKQKTKQIIEINKIDNNQTEGNNKTKKKSDIVITIDI
jgi:putative phage-type endonuclease